MPIKWVQNIALQKCSTVSEKIKMLSWLPPSLTKNEISPLFPDIKIYMIKEQKVSHKKKEFIWNQKHTQAIQFMKEQKKLLWNII